MITAIIQARMSSTRLQNKVLLPLGDTTVLGHTVRQVKKAKKIERVIVATSTGKDDDQIEAYCKENGIEVSHGSLTDVLDRYYQTAVVCGSKHIARMTADCPLIDPAVIDRVATEYEKGECDYISTGRIISTFPDGMDTEIFSFKALEVAWKEAKLPSEREHVTPFIWNHPERFRVIEVRNDRDLSSVRLTLDEDFDYQVIREIVQNVPDLSLESIVRYIEKHPEIAKINGSIVRDEGYYKSLKQDEETK
ncbi:MAG: glycosyltransferase family protein [Candidatus Paceibacterota bacterium]|jgi:spore coat polysaccharide biosynthesis protein SpsF